MADTKVSKDSRLFSVISYVLGILIAIFILRFKQDDRYVRFHAVQVIWFDIVVFAFIALICFTVIFIPQIATIFGFWILQPVWVVWVLVKLFLAWKAYKGEEFRLPLIGEYAAKIAAS